MFIGTVIAGFVDAFVPAHVMQQMLQRNMSLAVGLSGVLRIVFAMRECGLIPVIRRNDRKRNSGITYLRSVPIINPTVAVSTIAAIRG